MKKNAEILTCDVCGKTVSDSGEAMYGGSVFSGWYQLVEHGGSSELSELRRKKDWDIRGIECLRKFANDELREKYVSKMEKPDFTRNIKKALRKFKKENK